MPTGMKRFCTYPGCSTLVLSGRCSSHPYKRKPDTRKGTGHYGADWRKRRAAYLEKHPFCEIRKKCRGIRGEHVDHIVPLNQGGTHDESNLQTACHRCHSYKTATSDMKRDGGRFSGQA